MFFFDVFLEPLEMHQESWFKIVLQDILLDFLDVPLDPSTVSHQIASIEATGLSCSTSSSGQKFLFDHALVDLHLIRPAVEYISVHISLDVSGVPVNS